MLGTVLVVRDNLVDCIEQDMVVDIAVSMVVSLVVDHIVVLGWVVDIAVVAVGAETAG